MTEPTQSRFDEQLARFARGELSSAEARELAHAAVESPAWFEELTATALAKTAISCVPVPAKSIRHGWWRSPFLLAAAAVIVIGILVVPYGVRTSMKHIDLAQTAGPQSPATSKPNPTLVWKNGSVQPVLLAEGLLPAAPATTQVFRGQEQPARPPRQVGAVIELDGGLATINLGSIDGLAKGSKVEIYRDKTLGHAIGTLTIGTVFREQARGEIGATDLETQYVVRISDRDHLQALLQAANDFQALGELTQARRFAADASQWASTARVSIIQRAQAARLLASLDFQAQDLVAARTDYSVALQLLSSDSDASADAIAELQNNLAVLAMLRGDYGAAQKLLDGSSVGFSNQKLKAERLNNLGILAEQHGDRSQAEAFYGQALELLKDGSANERKIVETNLSRVKGLH